jgi:hypothetical protein
VDGGVSVEHFEYNLTSSRSVDIKVDAETITIEGSNDGSGVVRVSDIAPCLSLADIRCAHAPLAVARRAHNWPGRDQAII